MRKFFIIVAAVLLGLTACSEQKQATTEGVTKEQIQFPIGERIENPAFTGEAYLKPLIVPDSVFNFPQTNVVTFGPGAHSGKFTINGSGTQVYFSKGNLQATYNGSSWTWAFAANQWDYIGEAEGNGNTKVTDSFPFISENATVDLFGWVGASSDWTGVAQYGITSSTTTNSKDGYGNNASEALKSDWGTLMGSGWRTLTSAEWVYLFYSRTTEKGTAPTVNDVPSARYAKATVASKAGIILFPDSYTHPSDVTQPTNINTPKAAFSVNTYDATAWGKMESAGCVFLPAVGSRYGTAAYGAGTYCGYWSSSPRTSNVNYAYYVYLNSGSLNPADYDTRYRGYSVRLVRQVE